MEFLVCATARLPESGGEFDRLMEQEHRTGRQLRVDGTITHIWRLPGQQGNVAIYDVEDATQLHDVLQTLPLYRWTTFDVQPLARHPLDGKAAGS